MKIKISFFAILAAISLILSGHQHFFIPFIAALLHEAGHIIAAKCMKIRLVRLDIGILGARLTMDNVIFSYREEAIICAAGPIVNLISADITAMIYIVTDKRFPFLLTFVFASLCLGALNLLPIKTFDGGRIANSILSSFLNVRAADNILSVLSFISLFALWSASLYLLLRTAASLSLFVFSSALFANLFVSVSDNPIKND